MTGIGKPLEQHVKSSDISKSCADPGSFDRGGQHSTLATCFFICFILSVIPQKAGHHRLASETPFKWRLADRPINSEGDRGSELPPLKITSAYRFLTNIGTDPPREAFGPVGSDCFSRKVRMALCKIR